MLTFFITISVHFTNSRWSKKKFFVCKISNKQMHWNSPESKETLSGFRCPGESSSLSTWISSVSSVFFLRRLLLDVARGLRRSQLHLLSHGSLRSTRSSAVEMTARKKWHFVYLQQNLMAFGLKSELGSYLDKLHATSTLTYCYIHLNINNYYIYIYIDK